MTDEPDTSDLTPQEQAQLAAALEQVRFLAPPESPGAPTPPSAVMPPEVWNRMVAALDAQPALATVTPLRPRRRILPGLAAAAVAVIALGVGVSVMRPAASNVADAPAAPARSTAPVATVNATSSSAKAAAAPAAEESLQAPPPTDGPMAGAVAPQTRAMIMPTRFLMSSGTQYTSAALDQQVDGLMQKVGAASPALADAVPTPTAMSTVGEVGFTADLGALRDCITGIMHSSSATALVVDRATFDGHDVGIVVVPQVAEVDVWIVGPSCSSQAPAVLRHVMHAWSTKSN